LIAITNIYVFVPFLFYKRDGSYYSGNIYSSKIREIIIEEKFTEYSTVFLYNNVKFFLIKNSEDMIWFFPLSSNSVDFLSVYSKQNFWFLTFFKILFPTMSEEFKNSFVKSFIPEITKGYFTTHQSSSVGPDDEKCVLRRLWSIGTPGF